jgi:ParB family transcriptional regulator, chromosome partitioning protein
MSNTKRVLGRGLADLIPVGGGAANFLNGEPEIGAGLGPGQEISIASLHANPNQPRTRFEEGPLEELASSIKANGILQPIVVRPRVAGGYEIVAGERRYRAALRAGLTRVPIIVRELTDEDTLTIALIENLIREDIGPLEAARAFRRLMDDFGWTQEEMGQRVSKSRPAIANALRLLELPEEIQSAVDNSIITEGHARALLGVRKDRDTSVFQKRQQLIFTQVVAKGLSVREVERLMGDGNEPATDADPASPSTKKIATAEWRALEDRIRTSLGTKVRLVGSSERGKIEIEFFSEEELDGLIQRFDPSKNITESTDVASRSVAKISGLLASRRPLT